MGNNMQPTVKAGNQPVSSSDTPRPPETHKKKQTNNFKYPEGELRSLSVKNVFRNVVLCADMSLFLKFKI